MWTGLKSISENHPAHKKASPWECYGTHLNSWVKRGFKTNTECFSFNSEYIQEESVEDFSRIYVQRL